MKYEKLSNDIFDAVGGAENVKDAFYCVTRLRLVFKDPSKVDKKKLNTIDGIVHVREAGNQTQLVIGTHVEEVYREFCQIGNLEQKAAVPEDETDGDAVSEANKGGKKKNIISMLLDVLAAIILPALYAIVTGGMIKGILAIFTVIDPTIAQSGFYIVMSAIGDVPFYFMPFLVAYSAAKRFKLNEAIGLMIAGVLLYPTFLNQTAGESLHFLFFNIPAVSYTSTIIPVILCVWLFSYVYRFIDKHVPANFRIIVTGTVTFFVVMPLLLAFVAPFGNYVAEILSKGLQALFTFAGPVAGAIFCGFLPLLIITGMHVAMAPFILQNFNNLGYDFLLPLFFISNIAVAGATLGATLKIKTKSVKSQAISVGFLAILGITEPALYGIDIRYKKPLYASFIGGGVGGAVAMLLSTKSYAYVMPGIFSLPTYLDQSNNIVMILIAIAAAFATSFAASAILTKDSDGILE
ncbi:MAG: beta-glucoside system component [Chloroflexota bacterium]|nr:beta-glucoside system component [Chloroflexota bacterium]